MVPNTRAVGSSGGQGVGQIVHSVRGRLMPVKEALSPTAGKQCCGSGGGKSSNDPQGQVCMRCHPLGTRQLLRLGREP